MNNTNRQENVLVNLQQEGNLIQVCEHMLMETRENFLSKNTLRVPIAELSLLGAKVSAIVPALNTVTQTTSTNVDGLYRIANKAVGDTLKKARNGNYWGAMKTTEGTSKFVQLQAAGPISTKTVSVAPINPAIMMMAVALFSIEKELGNITQMTQQILSFMEIEKESEIEADLEMLMDLVKKYKLNWDNEQYVSNNHKLVIDIERTARKNMNSYKKQLEEMLRSQQWIVVRNDVSSTFSDLSKKFKYYKLSVYTFAFASLMEIMLGGNFEEAYVGDIQEQIKEMTETYRDIFTKCSIHLEKMSSNALETNVIKGVRAFSKILGGLVGSIPVIKEGPIDEFLQDSGKQLQSSTTEFEKQAVKELSMLCNPDTNVFLDKMNDVVQIYNRSEELYFDSEGIYLVTSV